MPIIFFHYTSYLYFSLLEKREKAIDLYKFEVILTVHRR